MRHISGASTPATIPTSGGAGGGGIGPQADHLGGVPRFDLQSTGPMTSVPILPVRGSSAALGRVASPRGTALAMAYEVHGQVTGALYARLVVLA